MKAIVSLLMFLAASQGKVHDIKAAPKTTHIGFFDAPKGSTRFFQGDLSGK